MDVEFEPQFEEPDTGSEFAGGARGRAHFDPIKEEHHEIALLVGREIRQQFAELQQGLADARGRNIAVLARGEFDANLFAFDQEALLIRVERFGLLAQHVIECGGLPEDERTSAITELLGDAGEFAFESGEPGAQGRSIRLTQRLGVRGRSGERIGMLTARAQKTDHCRFERRG